MRKGFTLVELSIALVVVGLLIGGMLVGQSLIDSARTNSLVSQLQQVDVALEQFKAKFKYFPGDSPFHSAPGDGDGKIENSATNSNVDQSGDSFDYELSNFWPHLQQNGFLQSKYPTFSNNASSGIKGGIHVPTVDYKSSVGKAVIVPYHYEFVTSVSYEFWYYVCGVLPTASNGAHTPINRYSAFTPAESLAIDTKMDDSLTGRVLGVSSYTGKILATNYMNDSGNGATGDCWTTTNTNTYNVNYTPKSCCLMVQMKLK